MFENLSREPETNKQLETFVSMLTVSSSFYNITMAVRLLAKQRLMM